MRQSLGHVVTRLVSSVCRRRSRKLARVVPPSWNGGYGYQWCKNARDNRGKSRRTIKGMQAGHPCNPSSSSSAQWAGKGRVHIRYDTFPWESKPSTCASTGKRDADPQSPWTRKRHGRYPTRDRSRRTACKRRLQTLHLVPACGNEPSDRGEDTDDPPRTGF